MGLKGLHRSAQGITTKTHHISPNPPHFLLVVCVIRRARLYFLDHLELSMDPSSTTISGLRFRGLVDWLEGRCQHVTLLGRKCELGCVWFVCVTRPCPIVLKLTPYYPDPLSSSPGSGDPDRIFQGNPPDRRSV